MSQFGQNGRVQRGNVLDDEQVSDGDGGFAGVNQRLQLNQLEVGEVRESLNGRMEGHWKPRRGVVARTGSLTSGGFPLRLPFFLIDSPKGIESVDDAGGVFTITMDAPHGMIGEGMVRISGMIGAEVHSADFIVRAEDIDTLEIVESYLTPELIAIVIETDYTSGTVSGTPLNDAANINVRASCVFSDPNSSNEESVVLALDSKAVLVDLSDYSTSDITYPQGKVLSQDSDLIQAFDRVFLFRRGAQGFEWFPNGRQIESASQSDVIVTARLKDHGLSLFDGIDISGLTGGTPANGSFAVASVIDKDTFTFVFDTSQTVSFGVTDAILRAGFTLASAGVYTQPQVFISTGNDGSVTNGLVSLDVSGNTTIIAGDAIVIYETNVPELSSISGESFEVASATTTNISFYAPVADLASLGGGLKVEFGGRFSVGGGFMHQPAAPWGIYFQRRLWVPFYYTPAGTFSIPTYTDRKITDEIAISDILDSHTFDQIANQFRITGGTSDYLVAMHGFYDDKLVVLNRNSLHLISGTAGSLSDTKVTQLTNEVGCLARKSVVMKGNSMFFLSDDGVYAVEFLNDYNLRGADEPVSKNIQPYIDRINKTLASEAIGVLFNNRYYLAVALDSRPGINDALGNNSILIFNFLNGSWESVDTFDASDFLIKNLIIGSAAERNNIYAVTSLGGLHELEAAESSNDIIVSNGDIVSRQINSRLTTRGYSMGNLDRKRFTDGQVTMQCVDGGVGEYQISFAAEDPDDNQEIGTTTDFLGGEILGSNSFPEDETGNIRFRIGGVRGYVGTLTLTRTIGSPKVTSIRVTGSVTNRQIISQV